MSIENAILKLAEAINNLAAAQTAPATVTPAPAETKVEKVEKTEDPKQGQTEEKVEEEPVKEEPVKEEPVKEEPVKEEPVKEEKADEAPTYTIDEVRAKLMPAIQEKGAPIVSDALAELGVQKLSDLDASKYGELLDIVGKVVGKEL